MCVVPGEQGRHRRSHQRGRCLSPHIPRDLEGSSREEAQDIEGGGRQEGGGGGVIRQAARADSGVQLRGRDAHRAGFPARGPCQHRGRRRGQDRHPGHRRRDDASCHDAVRLGDKEEDEGAARGALPRRLWAVGRELARRRQRRGRGSPCHDEWPWRESRQRCARGGRHGTPGVLQHIHIGEHEEARVRVQARVPAYRHTGPAQTRRSSARTRSRTRRASMSTAY
jgi:hypothetical protein